MVPTLSDAHAGRILAAVESALRGGDDTDTDPSAAIAKAAEAHRVPANHVGLMVRAYNTGRAAWQREAGETTSEKAAEFPLADTGRALAILCPDAAPARRKAADHDQSPAWYKPAPAPPGWSRSIRIGGGEADESGGFSAAIKAAGLAMRDDPEARLRAAEARVRLGSAVAAMERALREPGVPSFLDIKVAASAIHGPDGDAAMDFFYRAVPEELGLCKLAASQPYHRTSDHPEVYRALAAMVEAGRELASAEAGIEPAAGREKRALQILEPWLEQAHPQVAMPAAPSLLDPEEGGSESGQFPDPMAVQAGMAQPSLFDAMPGEPKLAGVGHQVGVGLMVGKSRDILDSMLSGIRNVSNPEGRVEKMVGRLSDPDHEADLSDIHTRAAIGTMVSRDPVLRGYDPRELASAYNEIAAVAPGLSRKPLLARPILRKYLTMGGNLDSFEGSEALKTEKGVRDLNRPPEKPDSKPEGDKK